MPLHRLLSLYQTANFRVRDTLPWNSCLVGMDLRTARLTTNTTSSAKA